MEILSRNKINVPQEENTQSDAVSNIDSIVTSTIVVPSAPRHEEKEVIHVVKHGETLYRIALNYHVSVTAIAKKNKLNTRKKLKYGIKLRIPVTIQ
jgi:LysM repeat protein